MKIKEGDNVLVTAGKDKGKKGKVMRLLRKQDKIVVEKVNIRTKHIKKTSNKPGEIIKFEAPIHVSNAMVVCSNCNKNTRVGYIKLESGKKQRVCKKCTQSLDKATVKKK
jgi:large subunit ribosomal protein L24